MNNPEHQPTNVERHNQLRVSIEQKIKELVLFIGALDYKIRTPLLLTTFFTILIGLVIMWEKSNPYDPRIESRPRLEPETTAVPFDVEFSDISNSVYHSVPTGRIMVEQLDLETGIEIVMYLDSPFEGENYDQWGSFLDIHNQSTGEGHVYIYDDRSRSLNLVVTYDSHYSSPQINGYENIHNVLIINPVVYQFSDEQIEDAHPRFFMAVDGDVTEFIIPEHVLTLRNPRRNSLLMRGETKEEEVQIFRISTENQVIETVTPAFGQVEELSVFLVDTDQETAMYFIQRNQRNVLQRFDIANQILESIELDADAYEFTPSGDSFLYSDMNGELLYSVGIDD
jgi:hypothetical protein